MAIEDEMKDVQQLVVNQLGVANGLTDNNLADGQVTPAKLDLRVGNVGVGTLTPSSKLTIEDSGHDLLELKTNGADASRILSNKGLQLHADHENNSGATQGNIDLCTNGSVKMRVKDDGNVGIGTTNPSSLLEVSGASDPAISLKSTGTTSSDDTIIRSRIGGTTASNYLYFGDNEDSSAGMLRYTHSDDSMRIYVKDGVERMRIAQTGKVGIGTTSPNYALDVEITGADTIPLGIKSGTTESYVSIEDTNTTAGHVRVGSVGNSLALRAGNATRIFAKDDGNVGIGTTSPTSALQVQGETLVSDDGEGDFVKQSVSGTTSALSLGATQTTNGGAVKLEYNRNTGKFHHYIGANGATNYMTVTSTGKVLIGEPYLARNSSGAIAHPAPEAELHVVAPQLGTTAGNSVNPLTLHASTGNYDRLKFTIDRESSNGGWDYASHRIQRRVDNTDMGYIKFGNNNSDLITFGEDATERMRIDGSGNVLIGRTDSGSQTEGTTIYNGGQIEVTTASALALRLNRKTSNGTILELRQDGSTVGSIGVSIGLVIGTGDTGLGFQTSTSDAIIPQRPDNLSGRDNAIDLGNASWRFDDIYATNPSINTSDRNEKQDIEALSEAEQRVAVACKGLLRKFRWKSAVEEKGDDARIHFGIIAQDLQAAFEAEGLDAGRYAMFISSTWWETQTEVPAVEAVEAQDAVYEDIVTDAVEEVLDEEGNVVTEAQPERTEQRLISEAVEAVESKDAYTRTDTYEKEEEAPEGATVKNRLGVRYSELLAFIISAI